MQLVLFEVLWFAVIFFIVWLARRKAHREL
jgi:hypothetical protein